ncbi:BCCT family transporter [Halarchaeum salinum]|uniref:BCCT family transporter n=1 Tax=Halarchaeum salinum TaxID=489912 RepID=A0AAV3S5H7_9EURY
MKLSPRYIFGLEDADGAELALFIVAMGVLLGLAAVGLVDPSLLSTTMNGAFDWVLKWFGWWFILLGFLLLVLVTGLTFSKYGKLRIGGQEATPDFDTFSWLSMVFTVGFGASILIWGVGEPISIANSPPPNMPISATPGALALAFMYIHEVFPGLAMWYLPVGIAFGIIVYTQGVGEYKIGAMLGNLISVEDHRWFHWLVNLSAIVASIGGIATTLGFSAQTVSSILGGTFGLESASLTYLLFAVIGAVFLFDVWLGLREGIRNAARATMILIGIAMALLIVVGPTLYMFELGLNATGVWLSNMLRLSLYTVPGAANTWAGQWTGFWWAWWAAWSIFVGSFVARVSKGRTIREMFLVLVIAPAVLTWIQHSLIGGWVLAPGYREPVTAAYTSSGIPASIATALSITPFGKLLAVIFVLVIAGYIITSLDSAVFMVSAITLGDEDPNARIRAWWGILLAVFGVMSLQLSGFGAIESFAGVLALPFTVFLLAIVYASYRAAREILGATDDSIITEPKPDEPSQPATDADHTSEDESTN